MVMARIDLARVRFLDETLREGDSRGYHEHAPSKRLKLLRSFPETTGVRHFSLGFALINESDRATLDLFLPHQKPGTLPPDLAVHAYVSFRTEEAANAMIPGLTGR